MNYSQRSIDCGSLRKTHINEQVTLNGWVHRTRDHGGIYFIDMRDRYGKTQIVINTGSPAEILSLAANIHLEYCISVTGTVVARAQESINPNMPTGEIEVHIKTLEILSKSETLPFMIEDTLSSANEDLRLTHRYLDLRSGTMQYHIQLRHKVMQSAREYLHAQDFLEIETPTLIRSTPEGARDFLVPSRLKAGTFYALPQSPQLYKQILMMSGMDKYYQFARCYRDEDARGDRQPEHTQLDMEMSFVTPENIYVLMEGLMQKIFKDSLNVDITVPFARITYEDAMNRYGSDKPDLRVGLELRDFAEFVPKIGFAIFEQALELQALEQTQEAHHIIDTDGIRGATEHAKTAHAQVNENIATSNSNTSLRGSVKLLKVPHAEGISRKDIEQLEGIAKKYGAKGLAWARYVKGQENKALGFSGGISKFLSKAEVQLVAELQLQENDLLLFVADSWITTCTALGAVRLEVARLIGAMPVSPTHPEIPKDFSFAWISDFPLFEWNEEKHAWSPAHHMFTMPQAAYLDTLEQAPGRVKGELYDLVCNGVELASGSIRIHNMTLQQRIFDIIGMPKEEAKSRFGFLLEAFKYGAPPHGGIAPGLDRLLMLMTGAPSIREVMSFPKNTWAASPMDKSPNTVSAEQLEELHLTVTQDNASKIIPAK